MLKSSLCFSYPEEEATADWGKHMDNNPNSICNHSKFQSPVLEWRGLLCGRRLSARCCVGELQSAEQDVYRVASFRLAAEGGMMLS